MLPRPALIIRIQAGISKLSGVSCPGIHATQAGIDNQDPGRHIEAVRCFVVYGSWIAEGQNTGHPGGRSKCLHDGVCRARGVTHTKKNPNVEYSAVMYQAGMILPARSFVSWDPTIVKRQNTGHPGIPSLSCPGIHATQAGISKLSGVSWFMVHGSKKPKHRAPPLARCFVSWDPCYPGRH